MELKTYVADAIKTESLINGVDVDINNLIAIMKIFIAAGNLLDDTKKNVFYNKPINEDKWINQIASISCNIDDITMVPDAMNNEPLDSIDPRLFHAIIGIATESTELVEAIITAIHDNTEIDGVNVREEIGDIGWYTAIAVDTIGADWDNILTTNILKLKQRYPDKFDALSAINRDLTAERTILEGNNYDGETTQ